MADLRRRTPFEMTIVGRRVDQIQLIVAERRAPGFSEKHLKVRLDGHRLQCRYVDRSMRSLAPTFKGDVGDIAEGVRLVGTLSWGRLVARLCQVSVTAVVSLFFAVLVPTQTARGRDDLWVFAVVFAILGVYLLWTVVGPSWVPRVREREVEQLRSAVQELFSADG